MSSTEITHRPHVRTSVADTAELVPATRELEAPPAVGMALPDYSSEHDEVGSPPPTPRTHFGALLFFLVVAGGAAYGAYHIGWKPRTEQSQRLTQAIHEAKTSLPKVRVVAPRAMSAIDTVLLPGDVRALEESAVYPAPTATSSSVSSTWAIA
ncbi:MAG: hypothetical protein QM775_27370 [Pirellulales bacterium]